MCSGEQLLDRSLPLNVDTVFYLAFTDSPFYRSFMSKRKARDITVTEWQNIDPTGPAAKGDEQILPYKQIRFLNYTLELDGTIVSSVVTSETQYLSADSTEGQSYTINSQVTNSGFPFSNCFVVYSQYSLTRGDSDHECNLTVHTQVVFKKYAWGMKALIEDGTTVQISDYLRDLVSYLLKWDKEGDTGVVDADDEDFSDAMLPSSPDHESGSEAQIKLIPDPIIAVRSSLRKRAKKSSSKGPTPSNSLPSSRGGTLEHTKREVLRTESSSPVNSSEKLDALLVRAILAILIVILALNSLLYIRLWDLEESAKILRNYIQTSDPKQNPSFSSSCDNSR